MKIILVARKSSCMKTKFCIQEEYAINCSEQKIKRGDANKNTKPTIFYPMLK